MYLDSSCAARVLGVGISAIKKAIVRKSARYKWIAAVRSKGSVSNPCVICGEIVRDSAQSAESLVKTVAKPAHRNFNLIDNALAIIR